MTIAPPMASPLFRLRHHCSAVRHIAAMLPLCPILSPFVLIYFRVTSAPACHLSPSAPSLRLHRFASPRFASPRYPSPSVTCNLFSLLLLVATLLVHPPLSLLPATLAHLAHLSLIYYFSLILLVATPRSYLLAIPPANSIAYHSSPSLPIPLHIWRLASRGPARVPSTVHSCPPSAPSPSPYYS